MVGVSLYDYLGDPEHPIIALCMRAISGEAGTHESERQGRVFRTLVEPFLNEQGEIIGCVAIVLDITERTLACVITIAFDRDCPGEDAKALTCYRDLLGRLTEAGYYSYRLGIQSMTEMSCENGYNRFLRLLKDCVDPENILSPGRYEPRRRGAAARG